MATKQNVARILREVINWAYAQDYHLTTEELKEIEKAIKHDKRPEVVQRSMAIRLLHLGNKPSEVAQMQAVTGKRKGVMHR